MNDRQIILEKLKNDNKMYKEMLNILQKKGLYGLYKHIEEKTQGSKQNVQSGGGFLDELRSKVDKSYVKYIDFSKPGGISDEDKRYIKTLSPEQKEILTKRAKQQPTENMRKFEEDHPTPARVVTGEELERIKSSKRDQKAFEEMKKKFMALSGDYNLPQIHRVSSQEYDDLENTFKNFDLDKESSLVGGGFISDKIMIRTLSKLNNKEIKMLCKLDNNVKAWCKKHGY